jgi:hypothetical protein
MAFQFSNLSTATRDAIVNAPSIEKSMLLFAQVFQQLENTPASNPTNANRVNVSIPDNQNVAISITLQASKNIEDGSFADVVVPYLVNPNEAPAE